LLVNGRAYPAPAAVVSIDLAADLFEARPPEHGPFEARIAVGWMRPPAPLFLDPVSVRFAVDEDGAKIPDRILGTVYNATDQTIPLLFIVTGGTGGFERKRAPLRQGLPPWGHATVELPLGVTEAARPESPLFVSVGGLNDVDPTVQFIERPFRIGASRTIKRFYFDPAGDQGPVSYEGIWRTAEDAETGVLVQVEQFHLAPVFRAQAVTWTWESDQLLLELEPGLRLIRFNLSPASRVESIRVAGHDTVWSRSELGNRFWLKSTLNEDGSASWQAGLFPPPAREHHVERGAGISQTMQGPALFIVGTGGSEELVRERIDRARVLAARWTFVHGGLSPKFLLDEQAEEALKYDEFLDHTLVLFGNEVENRLWRRLLPKSFPFRFTPKGVLLGGKDWAPAGTAGVVYAPRAETPHGKLLLCSDSGSLDYTIARDLHFDHLGITDFVFTTDAPVQSGRFDYKWSYLGHGGEGAVDEQPR